MKTGDSQGAGWVALQCALMALLRAKARNEERRLRDRFPEYAAYARRVPRFLPSLLSLR